MFGETLGACAAARRLPTNLILCAHPDVAPWLSKFFSRIDFSQFTVTAQPFSVTVLDPALLAEIVRPEPGVVLDSGLAIGCGFVNIE